MVSVILHIKGHCIETAAKKKYNELVGVLIKEENQIAEKQLDIILNFLKKADFKKLRKMGYDGSREMFVELLEDGSIKEVLNEGGDSFG